MTESKYAITKMDCPTEEQIIRNRLKTVQGIDALDFDLMNRILTVRHSLDDPRAIQDALQSVGMDAVPLVEAEESHEHGETGTAGERWLMGFSGAAAIAAEALAWTGGRDDAVPVVALALFSIALGGRETLRKGWVAVRTRTLNINFLMSVAVVGAIAIGQWPEAAMVTFLFGVAEMIEAYSLDRARNAIRALMELSPETADVRQPDGTFRETPAGEVGEGQIVRVRPGERVALDGRVTEGASNVNQAPITGESMSVAKAVGDAVFAGTINEKGTFQFEVTANRGNTTLSRIVRSVQEAQGQRAPTQRFVDSFARYYTPTVFLFAILVAVVPPLFFAGVGSVWIYKALVMLVIACPCALVISTPVSVVSGLASAARRGILVKGGTYLEEGRKLRVVALDKTGTLTHGAPTVTDVVPLKGQEPDELLRMAASLDAPSEHPVASAIVAAWTGGDRTEPGTESPERREVAAKGRALIPVADFDSITGRGVKGRLDGRLYYLGNHRLGHEMGICSPEVEAVLERLEAEAKTAVVLSDETGALGVLAVADTLRETSVHAVRELHALDIRTVMLTGDNARTAKAIGDRVGIDDARGDLLPDDKLRIVDELLARYGHVGMVGDGINDAPALAKSTVGFAMGAAGTDTAIETADVGLMQDDLRKLPEFIRLSRRTASVLKQNIALAIGIKVVFFALALVGVATLWMAVFADLGASLLVVFNGLRLLRVEATPTSPRKPF
ncbi:MAG: heavy metal translocating P-type ATPase [Fimbriimonas sp.]